jgi:hypothetical protein
MPRFSHSQLLMGTAFIAIILVFIQTEGRGRPCTMIEAISFSSDDSRIAVTKLNARDARTPMKIYKENVARTVSWLDASAGTNRGFIHQDYEVGNCGPAFRFWQVGRTSVLCNPSNDQVAMSAFGAGNVTRNVGTEKPVVVPLQDPACNIVYSESGRYLAASGRWELTVLDTQNDTIAMHIQANGLPFLSASLMSFADDDTRLVVAGDSGVHVWDIPTATQVSTVIQGLEPWINGIAVAPDDNLIVCSDDWVRRYDFAGQVVATLADKRSYLCSIASDGSRLAIAHDWEVTIYDLTSNKVLRSLSFQYATALALSSTGDQLAVGDGHGHVALVDTATGARQWHSNPAGRYRLPWTLPAAFLIVWGYLAWRLSKRQKVVHDS